MHSLETGELIRQFPLGIGDMWDFDGRKNQSELFIPLHSFLSPGIIYRYDFTQPNTTNFTVFREMQLNFDGFNRNDYDAKQVFYSSHDGTKIPMFIVQRRSSSHSGPKPTYLYGYGGFSSSSFPLFSLAWLFFLHSFDGILAVANIRGGGEYGDKWHDAGRLLNKQNSYADFQAAAEYLIEHNYTAANKIAIQGESNGGLMVGACINQRPDLYGAAVAQVGVMDMLQFHKFTVGAAWMPEYGNPDDKVHFENLRKFSPLHNIHIPNRTTNQYPATLITTGDHDDRVSPLHSLKFTAQLQHAVQANQYQTNPILLKVYKDTGHGAGTPTLKAIDEVTDMLAFLYRALHIQTEI